MPAASAPDAAALSARLLTPRTGWQRLEVWESVGSTNAEVAEWARRGSPHGSVLITDNQTAGRGRFTRAWTTPPGVSVACSVLVRPAADVPITRWLWLSPLLGLAVAEGVRRSSGLDVELKWPNDVLRGGRKLSGLLSERVDTPAGAAAVLGFGINVSMDADELPVPTATSLLLEGAPTDSTALLEAVLSELALGYQRWATDLAALRAAYRSGCGTIGRRVRVQLDPADGGDEPRFVEGDAVDVDEQGALVVDTGGRIEVFPAGDVVHLRPVG